VRAAAVEDCDAGAGVCAVEAGVESADRGWALADGARADAQLLHQSALSNQPMRAFTPGRDRAILAQE